PLTGARKRSAAASPAPRPTRIICIIAVPPFGAVRGGLALRPPVPTKENAWRGAGRTRSPRVSFLLNHVRQQAKEARALDRAGQLTLLVGRNGGDARGHDLAALGNVALQETGVLVIDLRSVGAGERAGLAAAEERPAG